MIDLTGHKISNSKAKTYRRCPHKFRYKYVDKLESKRRSLPLERGSWIHDLLMHYYDGQDWQAHHERLARQFYNNTFEEEREELGDLADEVQRIMRSYLLRYKTEDKRLRVVDSEVNEYITLPNGLKFNFVIDLIVEEAGRLWLWDHKTVSSFMDSDFQLLDTQLARYFWCAKKMGYTPLGGVLFNEIRTKPPTIPQVLKSGRLSQARNIDTDIYTYYRAIRAAGQNIDDYSEILRHIGRQPDRFFRRTRLPKDPPLMKTTMRELVETGEEIKEAIDTNRFPRTVDKSCRYECEFSDLCIVEYHGGDISSMVKMGFNQRRRQGD